MKNAELGIELYLHPTYFIDSEQPDIQRYVKNIINGEIDKTKIAIKLYYAIRDGWRYNPYNIDLTHKAMKASSIFNRENKQGYCIEKACLLAACLRAVNIPARLCFFDVRNHIGVEKLILLNSNNRAKPSGLKIGKFNQTLELIGYLQVIFLGMIMCLKRVFC